MGILTPQQYEDRCLQFKEAKEARMRFIDDRAKKIIETIDNEDDRKYLLEYLCKLANSSDMLSRIRWPDTSGGQNVEFDR